MQKNIKQTTRALAPIPDSSVKAAYQHGDAANTGKWRNAKGRFVPEANVALYDIKKEALLIPLLQEAARLSDAMQEFKRTAFSAWYEFEAEALEEYGVEATTEKGNGTLYTFDQQYKIQMCSAAVIEFDNRIKAAAELIKELLEEWGKSAEPNLMAVVNGAFETDSKGMINVRKILALPRLKVDDERWLVAMRAIQDAVLEVSRASYLSFFRREEENGKSIWKLIPLSLARA